MFEIGGQTFASIADVRQHIHNLLTETPLNEPLTGIDGEIMHELFLHHPDAEEKLEGQEVDHFKVGLHPQAGARAFCVVLSDGAEDTFSMKKCVSGWVRETGADQTQSKSGPSKKTTPQQNINAGQAVYTPGISGLLERFQRVVALHGELGKEIEQIQKVLADESKG